MQFKKTKTKNQLVIHEHEIMNHLHYCPQIILIRVRAAMHNPSGLKWVNLLAIL